jgi:hypothetical protein
MEMVCAEKWSSWLELRTNQYSATYLLLLNHFLYTEVSNSLEMAVDILTAVAATTSLSEAEQKERKMLF